MFNPGAHHWTFQKCSSGGTSTVTYTISCPMCGTSFDIRWILEMPDAKHVGQELLRHIKESVNPDCQTQKKINIMERVMES